MCNQRLTAVSSMRGDSGKRKACGTSSGDTCFCDLMGPTSFLKTRIVQKLAMTRAIDIK